MFKLINLLLWLRYLKPSTLAVILSLPDDDVGQQTWNLCRVPNHGVCLTMRGVSVKNEQYDGCDGVAWSHSQMEMTFFTLYVPFLHSNKPSTAWRICKIMFSDVGSLLVSKYQCLHHAVHSRYCDNLFSLTNQ